MPMKIQEVIQVDENELYHHGIPFQKWGVRRFQYYDGSLTPEGRIRYGSVAGKNPKPKSERSYVDVKKKRVVGSGEATSGGRRHGGKNSDRSENKERKYAPERRDRQQNNRRMQDLDFNPYRTKPRSLTSQQLSQAIMRMEQEKLYYDLVRQNKASMNQGATILKRMLLKGVEQAGNDIINLATYAPYAMTKAAIDNAANSVRFSGNKGKGKKGGKDKNKDWDKDKNNNKDKDKR